ncbi:hypothetical protein INR49_011114 [Caranx melampygus]|nr:hypothetical protein INR49_011114 [Caranx melampygus]
MQSRSVSGGFSAVQSRHRLLRDYELNVVSTTMGPTLRPSPVSPGCRRAAAWHWGELWSDHLAGSPARLRKCPWCGEEEKEVVEELVVEEEGGQGVQALTPACSITPLHPTPPHHPSPLSFSSSPQSISNAFHRSSNKQVSGISDAERLRLVEEIVA